MVSLCAHLAYGIRLESLSFGLILAVGLLSQPATTPAMDTNSLLEGWLAAQTNLLTWKADFTQTRSLKTLKQPLVASGRAWFEPPNCFRWELGTPVQSIALRRANEMVVIYPLLKRAERYLLDSPSSTRWRDALALFEAGFPRSRAELESRFRILSIAQSGGEWSLVLQPKSVTARRMMSEITVGLAVEGFALLSTHLVLPDGSVMRNDFTNAVLNAPLDPALFNWKPPGDFIVTEPLGQ